jgi:glutamate--cysteine ligase
VGIDAETMTFLNAFLLFCLLRGSPPSDRAEYQEIDANLKAVVRNGRDPALQLSRQGKSIGLKDWGGEILDEVLEIAQLLDALHNDKLNSAATHAQIARIDNSALTPSARILQRMTELKTSYFRFAMNQSLANSDYFRGLRMPADTLESFQRMSKSSLMEQAAIEAGDTVDFATYLKQLNES